MKIAATINLGDYNSIKIESNDHENAGLCMAELHQICYKINKPATKSFMDDYLRGF